MLTAVLLLLLGSEWLWICTLVRRERMYIGYAVLWLPMLLLTAVGFGLAEWLVPFAGLPGLFLALFLAALCGGLIYLTAVVSVLAEKQRQVARYIAMTEFERTFPAA